MFDGLGGDAPQDVIFPDTLFGGHRIVDRIAAAAMQQSVVPAGGAGQQLTAFKQRDLKSPQYQVVSQGRRGAAAADDDDVFQKFGYPVCLFIRCPVNIEVLPASYSNHRLNGLNG